MSDELVNLLRNNRLVDVTKKPSENTNEPHITFEYQTVQTADLVAVGSGLFEPESTSHSWEPVGKY